MRALIDKEKPPRDLWDLKLIPGGLIDLEFIAQVAVLDRPVQRRQRRHLDGRGPGALAAGFADREQRAQLGRRLPALSGLTQMVRLCLTGPFDRDDVAARAVRPAARDHRPAGLRRAGGASQRHGAAVRAHFEALLGDGGRKDRLRSGRGTAPANGVPLQALAFPQFGMETAAVLPGSL